MAFSPCAKCRRMYRGGANTFFVNVVEGAKRWSRRFQQCPDCATLELESIASKFEEVDYETPVEDRDVKFNCSLCGTGTAMKRRGFFANLFLRGMPERAFHGQLCIPCSETVTALYALSEDAR